MLLVFAPEPIKEDSEKTFETSKISSLLNEFGQYIKKQNIEERKVLLKLGIDYIEKIMTKNEGK